MPWNAERGRVPGRPHRLRPYDSGHRGLRMGVVPEHPRYNGLPEALRSEHRRSLTFAEVHPEVDPPAQVASAFELDRLVAEQVREAVAEDEFPLVLSGNCNTAVETIAGTGRGGSAPTRTSTSRQRPGPGSRTDGPRHRRGALLAEDGRGSSRLLPA